VLEPELSPFRRNAGNQAAIVFVHGFGGDIRNTWGQFPDYFAADRRLDGWDVWMLGYPSKLRVDLVGLLSGDPELDKVALRIATDAATSELKKYRTLGLIAHSMGGLVVQRALLDDEKLRRRTSRVILFGTPSGGLLKASLVRLLKPSLRDMGKDGAFIRRLRSDWDTRFAATPGRKMPFRFMAVAGERDEFVPAASAIGPFPADAYPECVAVVPGNHVQMVKPDSADDPSVNLARNVLLDVAAPAGPWNSARVAIEMNEFQSAIDTLEPHADELDQPARVQLALALDGVGRREDAIRMLQGSKGSSTDAMGTLAGRLKRRWLISRRAEDAEAAHELYAGALATAREKEDHAQSYYLGINVAFLELAYRQGAEAAQKLARQVLRDCKAAAAGREKPSERMWRGATEGEALLLLNDPDAALKRYAEVLAAEPKPEPWQIASMYQQALYLARVAEDAALAASLRKLFREEEA